MAEVDPDLEAIAKAMQATFDAEGGTVTFMPMIDACSSPVYGEMAQVVLAEAFAAAKGKVVDKNVSCVVCRQPWTKTRVPVALGILTVGKKPDKMGAFAVCRSCLADQSQTIAMIEKLLGAKARVLMSEVGHG